MIFSVWAPSARTVELVTERDGRVERTPMREEEGGWWRAEAEAGAASNGYRYAIDGRSISSCAQGFCASAAV